MQPDKKLSIDPVSISSVSILRRIFFDKNNNFTRSKLAFYPKVFYFNVRPILPKLNSKEETLKSLLYQARRNESNSCLLSGFSPKLTSFAVSLPRDRLTYFNPGLFEINTIEYLRKTQFTHSSTDDKLKKRNFHQA